MGENFYGFHYMPSSSAGQRLYICGGLQTDKIFTFLHHTHGLQGHTGSIVFYLGGGELEDSTGSEGELADDSEPAEDLCRPAEIRAYF
jgi:hypothetical protein